MKNQRTVTLTVPVFCTRIKYSNKSILLANFMLYNIYSILVSAQAHIPIRGETGTYTENSGALFFQIIFRFVLFSLFGISNFLLLGTD